MPRQFQASVGRPSAARIRFDIPLAAGTSLVMGLSAAILLLSVRYSSAELSGPRGDDRQVAFVVSNLLREEHVGRKTQSLDDKTSQRCFDTYLKTLDPMKLYFDQSDIDRFMPSRDQLDDQVIKGDIRFGYTVFETFLKRVDERVALVDKLVAAPHDYTVDETLNADRDKIKYATTADEMNDRWRKRIKLELMEVRADEKEKYDAKKAQERISRRYHTFAKRMHQTDADDLLEMYLTSMTTALDPHTTYMSPTSLENFNIEMKKQLEGIGAALKVEDGYTVVQRVVPGGPAEKDGRLKIDDRIVGVGQGESGEAVDTIDMRLSDVVKLIRGKKGTVVRLEVVPGGRGEKQTYMLTRAAIELSDSIARSQIFEDGKKPDGTPYKVGVIDLPSFYMDMAAARLRLPDYRSTTRDVRAILVQFNEKGVDAVILDLRRNGGGSLMEAISLTGLFIDRGPVVQVKDANGVVDHYDDKERGMEWKGPLVVLTSKFSASASEIFAGAIQDYRRGLIVGDHATHGKGTVQSLLDVGERLFGPNGRNLGALKITMQQFYRPNGDSTQKRGVLADVELPSITTHLDVAEGDLDYALEFDKVDASPFEKNDQINLSTIAELRERSKKRTAVSKDFDKVEQRIKRYRELKDRKQIPLSEKKFLAERAEISADKEIEKTFEEENDPKRPVVKRDYYFNESLAVTLDYLQLLKNRDKLNTAETK
jgi:carboxyl-terminal processing protease